jgi:hypothetical protein
MSKVGKRAIPQNLAQAGRQCWKEITGHWEISRGQWSMLEALCQTRDRIAELSTTLSDEGQLQKDRFGIKRIHPASAALKGEIGNYARLFRSLMLEAPSGSGQEPPGRPENFFPEEEE